MQGFLSSLELRVQFCLLVCCTYPSSSTVNKEKNLIDQRASLRVDTRETQHLPPPPPPPQAPTLLCLSSLPHPPQRTNPSFTLCLPPPPSPSLLFLPPLIQPSVQVFSPLEARWPLCSWCHSVWRVRTLNTGSRQGTDDVMPAGCTTGATT